MNAPLASTRNTTAPPITENQTVAYNPRKGKTNALLRSREYLTPQEVSALIKAARCNNRYGHRDSTMILLAYTHGLRATELCELRWEQIDFEQAQLHVRRVKRGSAATHPIPGAEPLGVRIVVASQEA